MKRLYRNLALTFTISALLVVLLFTVGLYSRSREESRHYLVQLLESVKTNLEHAVEDQAEKESLFREDYLNRILAVEYILSEDEQAMSPSGLVVLRELMELENICILDTSGNVLAETGENGEQVQDEAKAFLHGRGETGYHIRMEYPEETGVPLIYVFVKSENDTFAAVAASAELPASSLLGRKALAEQTLRQATTEYATSIAAVDKETGNIIGITANNDQEIEVGTQREREKLRELFESAEEDKTQIVNINGTYHLAVVQEEKEIYLMAFSKLDNIFGNVVWELAEGLAGIGIISLLTILLVRRHLKKYLFDSLARMETEISAILSGDYSKGQETNEFPEVESLAKSIEELKKEYIYKAEGIDRIESQLTMARTEAEYDKLTGLLNRSGFERYAAHFLQAEEPSGVLVIFDLDNFKKINDSEGHPEGDRALKLFAECLQAEFRKSDCIGRLGGDEFIVLMPNPMPGEILEDKFQSILKNVRTKMHHYYEKYGVSVSIGAVFIDRTIRNYERLYRCADTALYIAKFTGKDRFYINWKKISCMKRECIGCRKDCPRSRLLNLQKKEGGET